MWLKSRNLRPLTVKATQKQTEEEVNRLPPVESIFKGSQIQSWDLELCWWWVLCSNMYLKWVLTQKALVLEQGFLLFFFRPEANVTKPSGDLSNTSGYPDGEGHQGPEELLYILLFTRKRHPLNLKIIISWYIIITRTNNGSIMFLKLLLVISSIGGLLSPR